MNWKEFLTPPFTVEKEATGVYVGRAIDVQKDLEAIEAVQLGGHVPPGLDAIKRRAAINARRANGQLKHESPMPGVKD